MRDMGYGFAFYHWYIGTRGEWHGSPNAHVCGICRRYFENLQHCNDPSCAVCPAPA